MTKHQLIVLVVVGAALAACGKKKEAPAAQKTVDPAVASGSAAPAAPAAAANKIGPIDVTAASIDLASLFPGVELQVIPPEAEHEGGGPYETNELETIEITQNGKVTMVIELEPNSDRIKTVIVLNPAVATPEGLDVGKPISALAAKHGDVTCVTSKMGTTCTGASLGQLSYELGPEDGTGAPFGEEVAIGKIAASATIGQVHWNPPAGKGPTLTKRPPTIVGTEDDEEFEDEGSEEPRKPTADEVDRCARVYAVVKACGVGHDYEFGWVKSDKKKLSPADAKKACNVDAHVDDDGMSAFPVPVLEADKVAKLEAAAKKNCKAVTDTLDEVSPGVGPAGYDPSK